MEKNISVFDAAHKGDFEYVRAKLEENKNRLEERDSVSISLTLNKLFKINLSRIREC